MRPIHLCAPLLVLAAAPALAAPASWTVDKARSEIAFSGTHSGQKFEGHFEHWNAAIQFDPADLAHSSANVTIQTESAMTGDASETSSLKEADWFDPEQFPTATFTTSQIVASGAAGYVASGTLTIKGKSLPVTLPFTLTINGDTATMTGSTMVDRFAYGLGADADGSGTFVSRDIAISIKVKATREP